MNTDIHLPDGRVSAYGLYCGYVDRDTKQTDDGHTVNYDLYGDGCWHVRVTVEDGPLDRVELADGSRVIPGWVTFTHLTDARRFKAKVMRRRTLTDALTTCIAAEYDAPIANPETVPTFW